MPVTRTASRALRRSNRKQIVNLRRKRSLRTALGAFKSKPSSQTLKQAISWIDRAAKYQLLQFNKASRLKSQLVNTLKKQ